MARLELPLDTRDPRPLWHQIEEGLERLVASRALAPGALVPSVREWAEQLRVNPATVAKAFQRLVDRGLFTSRRGSGTFVAETPPELGVRARRAALVQAASRLASAAATLGASTEEARAALDEALARLEAERKES